MSLVKTSRRYYYAIVIGTVYITLMQSSMLMSASVEPDGFEAGVAAFNRGDFVAARGMIADYIDHDIKRLPAKAYIFAMQDKKHSDVGLAPSPELKSFIIGHSAADPLCKALNAKLHLMGYHPESNIGIGLRDLAGLGEVDAYAYALYTLGLYHEGVFTVPPSSPNLIKAKLKYEEACITGHKAAIERYTIVYQLLNPEPEGTWEGEDEGVSEVGEILSLHSRNEKQGARGSRGGTSVASSMISHQTSGRFYGNSSAASGISADSEVPKQAAVPNTNSLVVRPVVERQPQQRQRVSTRASTTAILPTTAAVAILSVPRIPAIAVGYETLYQRFLRRSLEYRPTPGSDAGLITLLFRDLLEPLAGTTNPLSGTFDLSRCGDAGQYISINLGYKKIKTPANANKAEIWICPKFLVEQELDTTASYLAPMMGQWKGPVAYFWTWGGWDVKSDNYDYLLKGRAFDKSKNLYEKWKLTDQHTRQSHIRTACIRNFLTV